MGKVSDQFSAGTQIGLEGAGDWLKDFGEFAAEGVEKVAKGLTKGAVNTASALGEIGAYGTDAITGIGAGIGNTFGADNLKGTSFMDKPGILDEIQAAENEYLDDPANDWINSKWGNTGIGKGTLDTLGFAGEVFSPGFGGAKLLKAGKNLLRFGKGADETINLSKGAAVALKQGGKEASEIKDAISNLVKSPEYKAIAKGAAGKDDRVKMINETLGKFTEEAQGTLKDTIKKGLDSGLKLTNEEILFYDKLAIAIKKDPNVAEEVAKNSPGLWAKFQAARKALNDGVKSGVKKAAGPATKLGIGLGVAGAQPDEYEYTGSQDEYLSTDTSGISIDEGQDDIINEAKDIENKLNNPNKSSDTGTVIPNNKKNIQNSTGYVEGKDFTVTLNDKKNIQTRMNGKPVTFPKVGKDELSKYAEENYIPEGADVQGFDDSGNLVFNIGDRRYTLAKNDESNRAKYKDQYMENELSNPITTKNVPKGLDIIGKYQNGDLIVQNKDGEQFILNTEVTRTAQDNFDKGQNDTETGYTKSGLGTNKVNFVIPYEWSYSEDDMLPAADDFYHPTRQLIEMLKTSPTGRQYVAQGPMGLKTLSEILGLNKFDNDLLMKRLQELQQSHGTGEYKLPSNLDLNPLNRKIIN